MKSETINVTMPLFTTPVEDPQDGVTMQPENISITTPLFTIWVENPQDPTFDNSVARGSESPHHYNWDGFYLPTKRESDAERRDGHQEFLRTMCFTAREAEVIAAHVRTLGYQSVQHRLAIPTIYCAHENWEIRSMGEEGPEPCAIRYVVHMMDDYIP